MSTFPDMIQIELTKSSAEQLAAIVNNGKYPVKYMHHVTLAFRPNQTQYKQIVMLDPTNPLQSGEKVKIDLLTYIYDDDFGVDAVTVQMRRLNGDDIISLNKYPHITISTIADKKPKDSNELLEKTNHNKFEDIPLTLDGIVKFITYKS